MSAGLDPQLFGGGDLIVRIMDLSGGNGSDPVEEIRGFLSVERCRAPGLDAKAVLDAWFAFGEDAEVVGAAEAAWVSGSELKGFAETPVKDTEERNWRILDPRRDEDAEDDA
jgi:hypothetical protein